MATREAPAQTAPDGAGRLTYEEANPLAAALVCRIAAQLGVRVLVIKGLSLQYHGLRPGYVSADVDVLVDPARFDDFLDALVRAGWEHRPTTLPSKRLPHHSETLLNPEWPNDLDVHSRFPGLLAGPDAAFEELWAHRVEARLAGCPCWVPDAAGALIIWALHSVRSTDRQPRHQRELDQVVDDVLPGLDAGQRTALAERAAAVGATRPLQSVPAFAALLEGTDGVEAAGEFDAWQHMLAATHSPTDTPFFEVLRKRPLSDWGWLIRWGLWPPREDLLLLDPTTVDTPLGRLRSRRRRLVRFLARASSGLRRRRRLS